MFIHTIICHDELAEAVTEGSLNTWLMRHHFRPRIFLVRICLVF